MSTVNKTRATASSLPMMSACPNYDGNKSGPKPAAEFGSLFHKAIEDLNVDVLFTEEAVTLAREVGKSRAACESAYWWAINYLDELRKDYYVIAEQSELNGQCSIIPGRNFYIDHFFLAKLSSDKLKAVVLDWKSSRSLDNYKADSCEQGWLYVAACFELNPNIEEVDMIFSAPFADGEDLDDKRSIFTFTREADYEWLKRELSEIVGKADDEDSAPVACSYCTWCRNTATCTETSSLIVPAMENRFGAVLERAKKYPPLMGKLRDVVPVLEQTVTEIKASANAMYFEEGTPVPGYRPVETKGQTRVKDPGAIVKALVEKYKLNVEDIAAYVKIDLKGIETIVRNSVPKGKGKKTYDEFVDTCRSAGWCTGGDGSKGSVYLKRVKKESKELT